MVEDIKKNPDGIKYQILINKDYTDKMIYMVCYDKKN